MKNLKIIIKQLYFTEDFKKEGVDMKDRPSHLNREKTEKIFQSLCVFKGRRKKGVTLIEVIISLALFAILAVGVANLVNGSILMNQQAKVQQKATQVGQQMLEDVLIMQQAGLYIGQKAEDVFTELVETENVYLQKSPDNSYLQFKDMPIKDTDYTVTVTFNPVISNEPSMQTRYVVDTGDKASINPSNYGLILEMKEDVITATNPNTGKTVDVKLNFQDWDQTRSYSIEIFRSYIIFDQSRWPATRVNWGVNPFAIFIDAKDNQDIKELIIHNGQAKVLGVCIKNNTTFSYTPQHVNFELVCAPEDPPITPEEPTPPTPEIPTPPPTPEEPEPEGVVPPPVPDEDFDMSTNYLNLKEVLIEVKLDDKLMFKTSQVIPLIILDEKESD